MLILSTEQEVANPGFALSENCGEVRGPVELLVSCRAGKKIGDFGVLRYTIFFLQDIFYMLILHEKEDKKISGKSLTDKSSLKFHGTGNTITRVHELLGKRLGTVVNTPGT